MGQAKNKKNEGQKNENSDRAVKSQVLCPPTLVRVVVEHAIGGLKFFNILSARFRNRKPNFVDDVALVGAALWNFKIS